MTVRRQQSQGFTLSELLVAMAIFMTLLGGLVLLFVGSLKAVQTGYQGMDAFEEARGALAVIKEDLMTGFGALEHSDSYTFYGTSIGFTFIGLASNTSDKGNVNQARITYVLYNTYSDVIMGTTYGTPPKPSPGWITFEGAFEVNGVFQPAYSYRLLRYEEPNVGDLESFPIAWGATFLPGSETLTLQNLIDNEPSESSKCAKRRELWIRMLAGGGGQVPNGWPILGKNPYDYAVTDTIVSTTTPENRYTSDPLASLNWDRINPVFRYDTADGRYPGNTWWNDVRSANCGGRYPCADPRLPEVVRADFWLMRESPHVGAPDFQRRFNIEVFLLAGYRRTSL